MSLAPSATVEYLEAALPLASCHNLGMAIAHLDLTNGPAGRIDLSKNYCRVTRPRIAVLGTATGNHMARSGRPLGRDRSQVRASSGLYDGSPRHWEDVT
jgi:hypothetical protein